MDADGRSNGALGMPSRWAWCIAAALVVLVFVAFWPAFSADYVSWDDAANFVVNPHWRGLTSENLKWMLTSFHLGHYQPLTWLSFGVQYVLVGDHPGWSHGINVGLHAINAVLMFLVADRMLRLLRPFATDDRTDARPLTLAAGSAAALFALHPLRVESVAWVTERRDLLSAAFLLPALLCYLRAVEVGGAGLRDRRWFLASVVLTFLSCASKAWGMSFFVVLIAMDMYPLRRVVGLRGWFTPEGRRVLIEKLPFAAIGVVTAIFALRAQSVATASKALEQWSIGDRVAQACNGLVFYLRQSVAPSGHSALYELPVEMDPLQSRYVVCYAIMLLLVGVALWGIKRAPGLTLALFLYAVLVSPVLGLLQSGEQFVADRYSYLATMPIAVGAGWCIARTFAAIGRQPEAARRTAAGVAGVVMGVVITILLLATRAQTLVWRNTITLWEHAAEVTPTASVLTNLATAIKEADPVQARALLRQATEANPRYGEAWFAYAVMSRKASDWREAERAAKEAEHWMAQAYVARQELATIYFQSGRREDAIAQYREAIRMMEAGPELDRTGRPHLLLGQALRSMGQVDQAVSELKRAAAYPDTRERAAAELLAIGGG